MRASVVVIAVALAAPAHAESTRDYVVREGDSCLGVAIRELGDQTQLATLHRLNPQLGKLPHKLVAGQILKLPVTTVAPDAELASPRGKVEVQRAGSQSWAAGTAGQDLFRSWRVGTREHAMATVRFADKSRIEMREDTVVVIFGPTATEQRVLRTTVERGVLRSRLAALDQPAGDKRMVVTTAAGTAELGDGSAVVDVDADGATRVANHSGKAAWLANAFGKVAIAANYGSKVVKNKEPTPPRPLPPPPAWTRAGELALTWRGDRATIRGAWQPVGAAVRYRLEIVHAATPDVVEARLEVPATITKLEAVDLEPVDHVVRVASVDAGGFEGKPSEPLHVHVVEMTRPPSQTGAVIEAPVGLTCRPERLVRDTVDAAHVTCSSAVGSATLAVPLQAPQLTGPPSVRVSHAGVTTFTVDAAGVEPSAIDVTATPGLELVRVARTATALQLTVRARAAGSLALAITGTRALVIPIVVDNPPPPPPARNVELAGIAGIQLARDADDAVVAGAELGVLGSHRLGGYLGFLARIDDGGGFAIAGLTARMPRGAIVPFARAGIAVDADRIAATAGGGIAFELSRHLVLRVLGEGLASTDDAAFTLSLGFVGR